jgi:hypothetical protein
MAAASSLPEEKLEALFLGDDSEALGRWLAATHGLTNTDLAALASGTALSREAR